MNKAHKTTIKDRIKNALQALKGKPSHSITYGIEVHRCDKCEREEPRPGKWVKGYLDADRKLYIFRCNACEYGSYHGFKKIPIWSYCPNCGARMEAPDE